MTYDANGNRVTGDGSTLTWTAYNKPRTNTRDHGNRSEFFYASDQVRYQQIIPFATRQQATAELFRFIKG